MVLKFPTCYIFCIHLSFDFQLQVSGNQSPTSLLLVYSEELAKGQQLAQEIYRRVREWILEAAGPGKDLGHIAGWLCQRRAATPLGTGPCPTMVSHWDLCHLFHFCHSPPLSPEKEVVVPAASCCSFLSPNFMLCLNWEVLVTGLHSSCGRC